MMKTKSFFSALFLTANVAMAVEPVTLPEVDVWGKRPLKEIGVERTDIDSTALHESVALSLADILAFNSGVFVKSHGKASLSTVAFRGTSPSHTRVTWNGMDVSNPMLGTTDFSTIPAFFVDKASLLHGSTSITETGGALGGMVRLATTPETVSDKGYDIRYTQGIGSYHTFDEFLRVNARFGKWTTSTRIAYSSSPNDFKFVNHDKKENIYDENNNIVGQYYPVERNRSGAYRDFNAMQQVYYDTEKGDKFGLNIWYTNANRELPMLTTDYGDERDFDNRQREQALRAVLNWNRYRRTWTLNVSAGYTYSYTKYDYKREISQDRWAVMTRSRSRVNTLFGRAEATWYTTSTLLFTANASAHVHNVLSADKNVLLTNGTSAKTGYDKTRADISTSISAKWQPTEPIGVSVIAREDMSGTASAFIPAVFVDAMIWRPLSLMVKGSVSYNHRFPSLNDLYFMPGGNPELKAEKGLVYDAGLSLCRNGNSPLPFVVGLQANWFQSDIKDWIIWLPTTKGFFSPRNIAKVKAYGIESNINLDLFPHRDWTISLNGSYSWTPSKNRGEAYSENDLSVGRQLPYVPVHSASFTGRLKWKTWQLLYKWCYYSKRYTMTSNSTSFTGHLPDYYMNNIVVEKNLTFHPIELQLKLAVNNLFNEHYLSVLSHPMPGINFEFFATISF